ncbi:MAG: ATP-dependent DNA helicase RecG [Bacteroidetes bacterium]|jgi:ATP-dependent DNA helicase RecG|nr:ATP-dependent DNA helicase RecG [Bacteroidota bacterium]MBT6687657.1 ATP-dependent DNA helicase RecG [Bacteroidota bacterium]MBT7142852.1 ATP-dependent DNA helicase RecG [Bacteroidota bacterium]MBT7492584.1 ATP-dependent DNA helicase RecG [Bacteroidota bacterium]
MSKLLSEIKYLQGVGPKRAELLNKEIEIFTFEDMLYYFPFKHIDKTKFYKISDISPELPHIQIKGTIKYTEIIGQKFKQRLVASFFDGTDTIDLVWFKGIKWIKESIKPNIEYIIYGKATIFNRQMNIVHPEIEPSVKTSSEIESSLQAHYSLTEKLRNNFFTSKSISKIQQALFNVVSSDIYETLPFYLVEKLNLLPLNKALFNIHFPQSTELLNKAQFRLKFEELFYIQLNILKLKYNTTKKFAGYKFPVVGEVFNTFFKNKLPFELTNAQKKVIKEMRKDMGSGKQMNRLLQGDVGSGKTLVALMIILIAIDNNFQACLMVPTEILANQHFVSISKLIQGLNVEIGILTGSSKKSERNVLHQKLQDGTINILIGTHALIEDTVKFKNLGLVIIDEQHRFGVVQRAKMWAKNTNPPHMLVMTATPIPRTLAMTVYGDLDVSVIDELPPGRKSIKTVHYFDSKRLVVYGFIEKQIKLGRQIYVVYPLIEESETLDYKDLMDGYDSLSREFPLPEYSIGVVHGRMKPHDKDLEMQRFVEGKTQILIATTVIEVGVDVPNASVMLIESTERFGLSQLHQLRGRVGRGAEQSFCILMTSFKLSNEARKRINIMVQTNNGFEIAEADMRLRGPGDIEGTQQSGIPFDLRIANLGKDTQILQYARDIAEKVINNDPLLENSNNIILKNNLEKMTSTNKEWSVIS